MDSIVARFFKGGKNRRNRAIVCREGTYPHSTGESARQADSPTNFTDTNLVSVMEYTLDVLPAYMDKSGDSPKVANLVSASHPL
jgi:hypothetical protein